MNDYQSLTQPCSSAFLFTVGSTVAQVKYQEAAAAAKAEFEKTNPKPASSKPKRPPSAYNNFMSRHLSEIKDQRGVRPCTRLLG